MKFIARLGVYVGLIAMALAATRPAVAGPASLSLIVNSTLDQIDDNPGDQQCHTASGTCTLRAAIMEANKSSTGATILVPAGVYMLAIKPGGLDGADSGDLDLTAPASGSPPISIFGAGAANTIIDANQIDRVLSVEAGRTASIWGLTLRGGYLASPIAQAAGVETPSGTQLSGGGIVNNGSLTMYYSTVSNNRVVNFGGGGIFNGGDLELIGSTIGPNNQARTGGGLNNANSGTLTVDRSIIYGNSAKYGAGIFNSNGSDLKLVDSTLSQNMAATDGGAIDNQGTANTYNATIAFNSADTELDSSSAAGGIYSDISGTVTLRNTLLAGNYATNSFTPADCTGGISIAGQNLIGVSGDPARPSCTVNGAGSVGPLNSLDTIGPLQNNGGPTLTHALLAGSNAIDAGDPVQGCVDGNSALLTTDQRGLPRVVGISCDIGAFEYLPPVAYLALILR